MFFEIRRCALNKTIVTRLRDCSFPDLVSKSSCQVSAPRWTKSARICCTTITNVQTSISRDSFATKLLPAFLPWSSWVTQYWTPVLVQSLHYRRKHKSRGLWSPLSSANEYWRLETKSTISQLEWAGLNLSSSKMTQLYLWAMLRRK